MKLPIDVEDTLHKILQQAGASARCLIVHPHDLDLTDRLAGRASATLSLSITDEASPPTARLASDGPCDLAVVIDAPLALGATATRQLLARLRNVEARAVVAAFAHESAKVGWHRRDFLALGFRQWRDANRLCKSYWLYRYDIHDYKLTPDWLGPRHWANPGRWNEERW